MGEAGALSLYAALLKGELEGDEALQASRHIFDLVMNSVHHAIWWKDVNSVYLGCNEKLAEYAGATTPADLIGKTDADCAWGPADVGRGGTGWYVDHDRMVVETGEPILGLREQVTTAQGRVMWVETNKVPLKDRDGNVIGTLGTFVDISERIEAESELKRTLEELDERVRDRTSELSRANETLQREVEERVRLEEQERIQLAQAEALRDSAAAIARSLQLDDVIEQVLRGVERLCPHHRSYVALYDNEGVLELAGQRYPGRPHEEWPEPHTRVPDLLGDLDGGSVDGSERDPISANGVVVLPLETADLRLGCLVVEPLPALDFTIENVDRLATIADQAASAISNSRSLLTTRSLAAVEERQRLANDLHDSVSQTLWTATLVAETLARSPDLDEQQRVQVDRLHTLADGALSEMRTLLLELRPSVIEETPLHDLVRQLVSAFSSRRNAECLIELGDPIELVPTVKVAIYRIVQESLNNIARHAQATEVAIRLSMRDDDLRMCVSDNGVGYDPEQPSDHLGLRIMAERAESIGAELEVMSRPGAGTEISLIVPAILGLPV
ncbi:MAG: histidine kinase [Acidimicrobiia bacterium]|nr:histidine kinase [Acidimicrobiia bacterium]